MNSSDIKDSNGIDVQALRAKMVEHENLHIGDTIDIYKFRELFDMHSNGLSEQVFAEHCLDIDEENLNKIKDNPYAKVRILTKTNFKYTEFDEIEAKIKEHLIGLNGKISYDEIEAFWLIYGAYFPIEIFADEVFNISQEMLDNLSKHRTKKVRIIDKDLKHVSRAQLDKVRANIAQQYDLAMGNPVSEENVLLLYSKFAIQYLSEEEFAKKIMGVRLDNLNKGDNLDAQKTSFLHRKNSYMSTHKAREEMIQKENLHIKDCITYKRFLGLYEMYGNGMSELDFAKYFLDWSYMQLFKLKNGDRATSEILCNEFILYQDLDEIERQINRTGVREKFEERKYVTYDDIEKLWLAYGRSLSLKMFANEFFNLSSISVDEMIRKRDKKVTYPNQVYVLRSQLHSIKQRVMKEKNLHAGDIISLTDLENLYNEYQIAGMSELIFAVKILDIPYDSYKRVKSGTRAKGFRVLTTYPIDPYEIESIREKVIQEEHLKAGALSLEQFEYLYQKYGSNYTEETFSEEILDVPWENVKSARKRKQNIHILDKIEVPSGYIQELRNEIMNKYNVFYNDLISLDQIKFIYGDISKTDSWCYIIGERNFVVKVLGIPAYNYHQLCAGTTSRSYVFADVSYDKSIDLKKIRALAIKEFNLHRGDTIDYAKFHEIHMKYAPEIREHYFAKHVLDLEQHSLDRIRATKNVQAAPDNTIYRTHILIDEPLPSDEEIVQMKLQIINEYNLSNEPYISYQTFSEIYSKYGGIMSEELFCDLVMEIDIYPLLYVAKRNPKAVVQAMQRNKQRTQKKQDEVAQKNQDEQEKEQTREGEQIDGRKNVNEKKSVVRYTVSEEQIEIIKRLLIIDVEISKIAIALGKSEKEIKKIIEYMQEQNIIPKWYLMKQKIIHDFQAGKSIIEIAKKYDIDAIYIKDIIKDEFGSSLRREGRGDGKAIEKIIENCLYTPKHVEKVSSFIKEQKKIYQLNGCYDKSKLILLYKCLVFVQGGLDDITFVSKMYCKHGKYDEAIRIIYENQDNEGITSRDRDKLDELVELIKTSKNKAIAVQLLKSGKYSIYQIKEQTGLSNNTIHTLVQKINNNKDYEYDVDFSGFDY